MSSFSGNAAIIGRPNFGIIDINPEQVALGLQEFLVRGSQLTGVALDDINRSVIEVPTDAKSITLTGLIGKGMKLFDAIVWITAGRPTTHPLVQDPAMTADSIPSLHAIARSVFYTYFFLLTQARYPVMGTTAGKPAVANFLRVIMGMTEDQSHYIGMLCSFEPQKFNPAWARYVNFSNFGQEALSRFGLGVAGYRMFGPFKLYAPKDGISQELQAAFNFARTVAKAPASWNVHPLTRNVNILTSRGNLNKNLANLILDVYTDEQINEMVAAKMLYDRPKREPNYINYKTWAQEDDISGDAAIFRS